MLEINDEMVRDAIFNGEALNLIRGLSPRLAEYLVDKFSKESAQGYERGYKAAKKESITDKKEEKSEKWKPKGTYWFVCPDGGLKSETWFNSEWDVKAMRFGNIFETIEAAEKARDLIRETLKGFQE